MVVVVVVVGLDDVAEEEAVLEDATLDDPAEDDAALDDSAEEEETLEDAMDDDIDALDDALDEAPDDEGALDEDCAEELIVEPLAVEVTVSVIVDVSQGVFEVGPVVFVETGTFVVETGGV